MTEALTMILEQLADEARLVRSIDLEPVSDLARRELEQFRQTWEGLRAGRRVELLTAMIEQAEANIRLNFHAVLRSCLRDADANVRRLAVDGLWEDERPTLVPALVELLADDPVTEVRAAAATSLGRFVQLGVLGEIAEHPARQAEAALRAAWDRSGEGIEVRRRALEGLSHADSAGIHNLIRLAYYHDDPRMRQSALFAMGRNADSCWNKIVLAELNSSEPAMRFEAAVAAGEMALRAAARPLVAALDDPDVQVREAAVSALGKIGGPVARRTLQVLVQNADDPLADVAAEALDELTFESDGLEDLILKHESAQVRRSFSADDEEDWEDEGETDADEWDADEDEDFADFDGDDDADEDDLDGEDAEWDDEAEDDFAEMEAEDPDWADDDDEDAAWSR